jgi:ribosomal protein S18 acetylase RimI-like enzyme
MLGADTDIRLRRSENSDIPFLRKMLYEAVFWRANADRPSFDEGLASPDVVRSLADWEQREGDTAVIALSDSVRVGAAWYRFWTDDNCIREYLDESAPVVVIGVHHGFRHRGVGTQMLEWLIAYAFAHSIQWHSLMVSKDNHALNLYKKLGFGRSCRHEDLATEKKWAFMVGTDCAQGIDVKIEIDKRVVSRIIR